MVGRIRSYVLCEVCFVVKGEEEEEEESVFENECRFFSLSFVVRICWKRAGMDLVVFGAMNSIELCKTMRYYCFQIPLGQVSPLTLSIRKQKQI